MGQIAQHLINVWSFWVVWGGPIDQNLGPVDCGDQLTGGRCRIRWIYCQGRGCVVASASFNCVGAWRPACIYKVLFTVTFLGTSTASWCVWLLRFLAWVTCIAWVALCCLILLSFGTTAAWSKLKYQVQAEDEQLSRARGGMIQDLFDIRTCHPSQCWIVWSWTVPNSWPGFSW